MARAIELGCLPLFWIVPQNNQSIFEWLLNQKETA
jgi:hypothetical protein